MIRSNWLLGCLYNRTHIRKQWHLPSYSIYNRRKKKKSFGDDNFWNKITWKYTMSQKPCRSVQVVIFSPRPKSQSSTRPLNWPKRSFINSLAWPTAVRIWSRTWETESSWTWELQDCMSICQVKTKFQCSFRRRKKIFKLLTHSLPGWRNHQIAIPKIQTTQSIFLSR